MRFNYLRLITMKQHTTICVCFFTVRLTASIFIFLPLESFGNCNLPIDSNNIEQSKKEDKKTVAELNTTIEYSLLYLKNNNYGTNGIFNILNVSIQPRFLKLPVKSDFSLQTDPITHKVYFNGFNFSLNKEQLENNLRDRLKKYETDLTLKDGIENLSDSLASFERYRIQISDSAILNSYSKAKQWQHQTQIDSVNYINDSGYKNKIDSINQIVARYENYQAEYNKLFIWKKKLIETQTLLSKKDSISEAINTLTPSNENLNEIKNKLKNYHGISRAEEIATSIETFSIGKTVLNESMFTFYNFSFTGLNTDYFTGKYLFGVSLGKQASYSFNNYSANGLTANYPGSLNGSELPYVSSIRFGLGNNESGFLHLSINQFIHGNTDNNTHENINSRVVSLIGENSIGKNLSYQFEAAQYFPNSISNSESYQNKHDRSYHLNLKYELSPETMFGIDYSNVGSDFLSPGNPFLFSGYETFKVFLKQSFFHRKFIFKVDGSVGRSNSLVRDPNTMKKFSTSLKYNLSNVFSVVARYSGYFIETGKTTNNNNFLNNLYSLSISNFHKVFNISVESIFSASYNQNISNGFNGRDGIYFSLNENICLTDNSHVLVSFQLNKNRFSAYSLDDYLGRLSYQTILYKKISVEVGGELNYRNKIKNYSGGLVNIVYSLGKFGSIRTGCNYKIYFAGSNNDLSFNTMDWKSSLQINF